MRARHAARLASRHAGVRTGGGHLARRRLRLALAPPAKGAPVLDLVVARRSLYVMREGARWGWQHAVAPTMALRHSVTFRTLRD